MKDRNQKGFTLIELLIVVAIIGIIAAIAIPGLLRARMSANEGSAIASLRAINTAQMAYSSSTGGGGFAVQLSVLAAACPGSTVGFIGADLNQDISVKSGYTVTMGDGTGATNVVQDCNSKWSRSTYQATAIPTAFGSTGGRSFLVNGSGTIFFTSTATAPPYSGGVAIQ